MIISTFSPAWLLMFAVQLILIAVLTLLGRGRSVEKKEHLILGLFSFICVFYVFYKGYLISPRCQIDTCFWNELPLALCQVASMMILPAVLTKNRILYGFVFFVSSLCSLMGLLMPVDGFHDIPLLSPESIGYFGFHGLVFVQAILVYTLGLYRPLGRDVPKIMALLALIALAVHGINFLLRCTVYPKANYFFTYFHEDNPVLKLFRGFIDINYVYLLPLLVPAGLVVWILALLLREKKKVKN